jgi:hypothetical protein
VYGEVSASSTYHELLYKLDPEAVRAEMAANILEHAKGRPPEEAKAG